MKNIIFDLGGVILVDKPISVIDKNIYDDVSIFFDNWNNLDLGIETLEDKFNKCNIDIKYKDILVNYYKYRKLNIELLDIIKILKNNNYNIYILSDNNYEAYNYYKNLFNNIDGWVLSCEYNTLKKDGKLFDILIDKYNLIPGECYYIDNNIDNINISNKHGIYGYLYDNNDNLLLDMKDKGVNYYE